LDRVYQHPRESLATHGGPLICWRWSIVPHELAGNFARNNIVNSPSCSLFVCSKTNLRKLTKNLREEKLSYALTNLQNGRGILYIEPRVTSMEGKVSSLIAQHRPSGESRASANIPNLFHFFFQNCCCSCAVRCHMGRLINWNSWSINFELSDIPSSFKPDILGLFGLLASITWKY
jgi:hypothetical protein